MVRRAFREEDFAHVPQPGGADGRDHAPVFTARVGGRRSGGRDVLHVDEGGLIDRLVVVVRPLPGARAPAEATGARPERITEATGPA